MGTTPPPRRHRLPVTLPPPSSLSSNWKRLQESLKANSKKVVKVDRVRVKQEEIVGSGKEDQSPPKRQREKSRSKDPEAQPAGGKKRKADEISGKIIVKQNGIVSQKQNSSSPTTTSTSTSTKKRRKMPELVVDDDKTLTTATTLIEGIAKSKPLTPSALAAFAEDNDLSPEDLARAYGVDIRFKPPVPTAITATTLTSANLTTTFITTSNTTTTSLPLPIPHTPRGPATLGKYLSLDCEMVGCGPPPPNELSQLARISIVNYHGLPILDTFVLPVTPVTDWRTFISGVRPSDMANAIPFSTAREQVQTLLRGRILVGHALQNDLKALNLKHPRRDVRDTSQLELLRKTYGNGRAPALRTLSKEVLGVEIQGGEHSSVVDARACMLVYRRFRREFEEDNVRVYGRRRPGMEAPRVVVGAVGLGEDAGEEDGEGESDSGEEDSDEDEEGGKAEKKSGGRKKRNRNKKKKRRRKYK